MRRRCRKLLDAQKPIRSHVRVEIRLANGNRLAGIVKDGRMVERVDGLRFVDAHADDKGAGIHLGIRAGPTTTCWCPY